MLLPEDSDIALPEFDANLIPRLYKEGGLKKVDQILEIFRQSIPVYLDALMGRVAANPGKDKAADELEILDRLKQLAIRVGANALTMMCEDLALAVSRAKKPMDQGQKSGLEKTVVRARDYVEEARKKL